MASMELMQTRHVLPLTLTLIVTLAVGLAASPGAASAQERECKTIPGKTYINGDNEEVTEFDTVCGGGGGGWTWRDQPTTGPNDPAPTRDDGNTAGDTPYRDPREEMTRDEECVLAKRDNKRYHAMVDQAARAIDAARSRADDLEYEARRSFDDYTNAKGNADQAQRDYDAALATYASHRDLTIEVEERNGFVQTIEATIDISTAEGRRVVAAKATLSAARSAAYVAFQRWGSIANPAAAAAKGEVQRQQAILDAAPARSEELAEAYQKSCG